MRSDLDHAVRYSFGEALCRVHYKSFVDLHVPGLSTGASRNDSKYAENW